LQGTISTTTVSAVVLTLIAGTINSTQDTARRLLPTAALYPVSEDTVKGIPSSRINISEVNSRSSPWRRTVVFSVTCRGLIFRMDTRGSSSGFNVSPGTFVSFSGVESNVGNLVGAPVTTFEVGARVTRVGRALVRLEDVASATGLTVGRAVLGDKDCTDGPSVGTLVLGVTVGAVVRVAAAEGLALTGLLVGAGLGDAGVVAARGELVSVVTTTGELVRATEEESDTGVLVLVGLAAMSAPRGPAVTGLFVTGLTV
jgi:hypothetical protein